jgi:hypothetical protein
MKNLRSPQVLTDLYRDLRDRRLLVPALALAVALIAVPMALSSPATPAPTAPATAPAASGPAEESAAEPAVLTRQLGVTAYRKRLERLSSKNPFQQQFTLPEVTSKVQQSSLNEPSSSVSGVTASGGASASTSSTGQTTPTSSTSPGASAPASPPSKPSDDAQKPITEVILRRIDVKVGPQGELVEKTGVEQLKMLPSSTTPVVIFLGTSESGGRAFFLVSSDVTAVSGDGTCLATTPTCQFLTLKEGEVASFDYAPDATTYKLRLVAIRDVVIKKTRG